MSSKTLTSTALMVMVLPTYVTVCAENFEFSKYVLLEIRHFYSNTAL